MHALAPPLHVAAPGEEDARAAACGLATECLVQTLIYHSNMRGLQAPEQMLHSSELQMVQILAACCPSALEEIGAIAMSIRMPSTQAEQVSSSAVMLMLKPDDVTSAVQSLRDIIRRYEGEGSAACTGGGTSAQERN